MLFEQHLSLVQGQNSLGSTGGPCNLDHDIKKLFCCYSYSQEEVDLILGYNFQGISALSHLRCGGQILLLLRNGCWACK